MILTFIVIGQMIYYDGWKQWPTKVAVTISTILICAQIFGLVVLAVYGPDFKAISYLSWLYLLSGIKVLITFLKFLPQVLYNYERKSTKGWSMPGTIMDLMGSILSISQLILDCYFLDDWKGVQGNFIKLGLGVISGTYDVIFIIQHYVMYPGTGDQYHQNNGNSNAMDLEMSSSGHGLLSYKHVDTASDSGDSDDEKEEEVFLSPFASHQLESDRRNTGNDEEVAVDVDAGSCVKETIESSTSASSSLLSSPGVGLDMDVTWLAS
jgi:hypothetical protein